MGGVKAVHEEVAWKVLASSTMLNSVLRTSIQLALAPERLTILIATS
jgi:predicted anti-sigma-YlaC factor YlaD